MCLWYTGAMTQKEVTCAIIRRDRHVLMIRRQIAEGKFLWAFPSGQIEDGETAEAAAVRECHEELGIDTTADMQFASREHPITGRIMRYVPVILASGSAEPEVIDTEEIAELRWVLPDEADELSGNTIFEPVRKFIRA